MANHVALIEQMRVWANTLEHVHGPSAIGGVIDGLRQVAVDLERCDQQDAEEGAEPDESHP